MAQENLNTSTPNDGLGDFLRSAFIKVQNMFTELYSDVVFKVVGKDLSTNDFTDVLKDKLDNIEAFAEVNIQSDWNQLDDTKDDYIKNKPTIPVTDDFTLNGGYIGTAQDIVDLIATGIPPLEFNEADLVDQGDGFWKLPITLEENEGINWIKVTIGVNSFFKPVTLTDDLSFITDFETNTTQTIKIKKS